ncbi:abortive infection family protein [Candidatus Oleimmundimicrobium sp.]|uniref:abortive infection family protein n=1 Tax=Candidatus Oleimmundimicrobium sp. TaxID=3060597 RepID=UPI00271DA8B9|nr:abortive infection family protein [Candidatus Oleimmundimicrobium sp.]MDO8885969.1 abortive infection family protein [Candidatus Oleimmundimicrobium sp.]
MSDGFVEPKENDNIDCHLQQVGMGTLICRAARQTGDKTTNEVNPTMCFNCSAGQIFREVGCDAALPKVRIHPYIGGASFNVESLFCKIRKRETDLDFCRTCGLVTAETTRQIISTARGLFEAQGFYSAYKDIEKAREAIRDGNFENAVTRSIACLESTMRICHEKLGKSLPRSKQVTDLWKSTRGILNFDKLDSSGATLTLMNTLSGVVAHLGGLRNILGDAHGKGEFPPDVSENIAELAINTASTLSTTIIRRFNQTKGAVVK